jgi:ribonuclease P/MRP protein subunit RPP1
MALTAGRAGYDDVVLRNHTDADEYPSFDVPKDTSVRVHEGIEVRAENVEGLHERVRRAESDTEVVAVHGGDETVNRAAVEAGVDLLAHPNRGRGRSFDHVLAREAAEKGVAVELPLAPVLRSSGGERVNSIRDIHETLKLLRKYETPFVVSADPYTHLHIRAPREMRAVAQIVGVEDGEFERATKETPARILEDDDAPVEVVE